MSGHIISSHSPDIDYLGGAMGKPWQFPAHSFSRFPRKDVNLGIDFVGQGWATGSLGTNKAKNCWAPRLPLGQWNHGKIFPSQNRWVNLVQHVKPE